MGRGLKGRSEGVWETLEVMWRMIDMISWMTGLGSSVLTSTSMPRWMNGNARVVGSPVNDNPTALHLKQMKQEQQDELRIQAAAEVERNV